MRTPIWSLVAMVLLAACGGDGGGGTGGGSPPPAAPVTPAPSISYNSTSYTFTSGVPVPAVVPVYTGTVTSWSIDQPLPPGLTFNTTDGSISGTPSAASAAADYVITAQNSGGSDTFELTVAVESGVLLNVGHHHRITVIRREGNRLLSVDSTGHWVLWDATSTDLLAQGQSTCTYDDDCRDFVHLAGSTLLARISSGLEVRDASDGRILATIATPAAWWELASDGSYVAAGTSTEVTAWTPTGTSLVTRPGDYASGKASATPTQLRIADGGAGIGELETIAVSSGTSSTTTFQGNFHSWFLDGERFLTHVSTTVWTYGADGTQQDIRALPAFARLVGQGDYFWIVQTSPRQLVLYSVGASASPAASFALPPIPAPVPSEETIGILAEGVAEMSIIDLSGATPVKVDRTLPTVHASGYGASTGGELLVGNRSGVVFATSAAPGTARRFGLGAVASIAANEARIAVATASGLILYFDAASRELQGTIDFDSSKVRLSADGTVLAAIAADRDGQYQPDRTLRIYSLPSENILREEPYDFNSPPYPVDISLSASGQVFGTILRTNALVPVNREVHPVGGGALIWSDSVWPGADVVPPPIHLSPDGSLIAVSNGGRSANTATNIMVDGELASAVSGVAIGWIEDNRLLVNRYVQTFPRLEYQDSIIVNAAGQVLQTMQLPYMTTFQPLAGERIYLPESNIIVSLNDGATLWSSEYGGQHRGAATATHVIFASGATVRAEPY